MITVGDFVESEVVEVITTILLVSKFAEKVNTRVHVQLPTADFCNFAGSRPNAALVEESLLWIGFPKPPPNSFRQSIQQTIRKANDGAWNQSDWLAVSFFAN